MTGELHPAPVFVATMGASSETYCEAQDSQALPNWIGGHVQAFEYFGGVPEIVVPDYVPRNIIGSYPGWDTPGAMELGSPNINKRVSGSWWCAFGNWAMPFELKLARMN